MQTEIKELVMGWTVYDAKKCFPRYSSDWDKLNQSLYNNHPLLDSRLVYQLIEYFGNDSDLTLAIEYDSHGISQSILLLEHSGIRVWKTFSPSQAPIGLYLLSKNFTPIKLAKALSPPALKIDLFSEDTEYQINKIAIAGTLTRQVKATTMNVLTKDGFRAYWESRPRKLKKNIKRYIKRATEDYGELSLKVIESPEDVSDAVERYAKIESKGWKGQSGTALSPGNQQSNFYGTVLYEFAKTKQTAIYELYFGKNLVSSRLSIRNEEMQVMLKTTFDEEYARYAPGRLQMYMVLRKIFDQQKIKVIEFYTNANNDQLQWKSESRQTYHLTWYRFHFLKRIAEIKRTIKTNE